MTLRQTVDPFPSLAKTIFLLIALLIQTQDTSGIRFRNRNKGVQQQSSDDNNSLIQGDTFLDGIFDGRPLFRDFVDWSTFALKALRTKACVLATVSEDYRPLCDQSTELQQDERFSSIPKHHYANYLAMSIAYPIIWGYEERLTKILILFPTVLRFHRTLAYGNALRLLGYSERVVNDAYWDHFDMLSTQDNPLNNPDDGPGLAVYCNYINAEYEQLKQFARDNYSDETMPTLLFNRTDVMAQSCSAEGLGYLIRNDWEHHRREVVTSMMSTPEDTKAMVMYTVWHWESLFVLYADGLTFEEKGNQAYEEKMKSFEFFLSS